MSCRRQSALLSYWNFKPDIPGESKEEKGDESKGSEEGDAKRSMAPDTTAQMFRRGGVPEPQGKSAGEDLVEARTVPDEEQKRADGAERGPKAKKEEEEQPPPRRIPVFFLDEAHKVGSLVLFLR